MNSNFYSTKRFEVHLRDRTVYEKAKCLCDISTNRKIEDDVFNELVNQLIKEAYDKKLSPLGV